MTPEIDDLAARLDDHAVRFAGDYGYNVASDLKRAAELLRSHDSSSERIVDSERDAKLAREDWADADKRAADAEANLAFAVEAERERCAKIAETAGCGDPQCMSCYGNQIAAAIRDAVSEAGEGS